MTGSPTREAGPPPRVASRGSNVARLYDAVSAAFDVDTHVERITALPRVERCQTLAR